MYKIIACDLDETLLNSERKVSEADKVSILKAKEKGVRFVLATGRGYTTVQNTLEEIGLKGLKDEYVISFNGGALTENYNNRVIAFNGITYEQAEELFNAGLKYDVCIHVYSMDAVYGWNVPQHEYDYVKGRAEIIPLESPSIEFLKGQNIPKVLYMNTDFNYLKQIQDELGELISDMDISFSSGRYIEFNAKGINKGFGLKKLAEILDVDIKDTIAVGDNYNDLPMIETAGLGIGVANTVEGMKSLCDYITEAKHDQNPITEIVEKFIL